MGSISVEFLQKCETVWVVVYETGGEPATDICIICFLPPVISIGPKRVKKQESIKLIAQAHLMATIVIVTPQRLLHPFG